MTAEKNILRQEALRHRAGFNLNDENPADAVARFMAALAPEKSCKIALYWPKDKEFDVSYLLDHLLQEGYICQLPVIQKDSRILKFARWSEGCALTKNKYGILEPETGDHREYEDPDIVLVPLLAFDRRGTRLGYGGGYYDATLQDLRARKTVIAVGIAYAAQAVLFNLPKEDHDQPLDWVITPKDAHFYGDL